MKNEVLVSVDHFNLNLNLNHSYISIIYYDMALLYYKMKQYDKALMYCQHALKINLNIYKNYDDNDKDINQAKDKDNKDKNIVHIENACIYSCIGDCYEEMNKYNDAILAKQNALDIYLNYQEKHITHFNFNFNFNFDVDVHQTSSHSNSHSQSHSHSTSTVGSESNTIDNNYVFKIDISLIYDSIGLYYFKLNEYEKSIEYMRKCVNIRYDIVTQMISTYENEYVNVNENENELLFTKQFEYQYENNINEFENRDKFKRKNEYILCSKQQCKYALLVASNYKYIGDAHFKLKLKQYMYTLQYYQYAINIYKKQLKIKDKYIKLDKYAEINIKNKLLLIYKTMIDIYMECKQYDKLLKIQLSQLKICNELYGIGMYGEVIYDIGMTFLYHMIGWTYLQLNQYENTIKYALKSIDMRKLLLKEKEKISNKNCDENMIMIFDARSYRNIGNAYNGLKQYEQALIYHQKSLTLREKLYATDNPNHTDILESKQLIQIQSQQQQQSLSHSQQEHIEHTQ